MAMTTARQAKPRRRLRRPRRPPSSVQGKSDSSSRIRARYHPNMKANNSLRRWHERVKRGALVAGDFNCVSGDLDVTLNASGRLRTGYLGDLQLMEETYGLIDVWRDQHPGERAITHVCASDHSEARLDRWLLLLDVLHVAQQSEMWEVLPGDHAAAAGSLGLVQRPPTLDVPLTAPG